MGEDGARGSKAYDLYAQQRIIQKLADLGRAHKSYSLGGIAADISRERNVEFHREYMTRLRNFKLSDPLIDIVVDWIVRHHDPKFRTKLSPDAIFGDVGESSRDFYFHYSQLDPYEAWEENILKAFEGVYLCAPAQDRNSYLPSTLVRQFLRRVENKQVQPDEQRRRSLDIKQYIAERSILILRATPQGYYYASEFPYSLLFPPDFETLDVKMVHEGIGVASGNSIRVFLRECLSRVGKSHSILITPNGANEAANPHGLSLFTAGEVRADVRAEWDSIDPISFGHLKAEFATALGMDYHLEGTAQIEVSPVPNLKNRIEMTFSRDYVYHKKPDDFLRHPGIHFVRPDVMRGEQIERIINHPLAARTLL